MVSNYFWGVSIVFGKQPVVWRGLPVFVIRVSASLLHNIVHAGAAAVLGAPRVLVEKAPRLVVLGDFTLPSWGMD